MLDLNPAQKDDFQTIVYVRQDAQRSRCLGVVVSIRERPSGRTLSVASVVGWRATAGPTR